MSCKKLNFFINLSKNYVINYYLSLDAEANMRLFLENCMN